MDIYIIGYIAEYEHVRFQFWWCKSLSVCHDSLNVMGLLPDT